MLAFGFGCAADVTQVTAAAQIDAAVREDATPLHFGLDAVFDSIAQAAPSFAGLSYENGVFVVQVTQLTDSVAAKLAVERALDARVTYAKDTKARLPKPVLRLKAARNSWLELMRTRDQLLLSSDLPELLTIDVDEVSNRLVLETETDEARTRVNTVAGRLALKDQSILEVRTSVRPTPNQSFSLNDRFRPLLGGTLIGPKGCSAGVPAFYNSAPVLVTASHCTQVVYGPDYGSTSQPLYSTAWGTEVFDLNTYRCGPWYARKDCRRADVAAYSLTNIDLGPNETAFLPGLIGRPSVRMQGVNQQVGPRDVVSAFQWAGSLSWAVSGEIVDRVGVTTGWQSGAVYHTCKDTWYNFGGSNKLLVCQDYAKTFSQPGDSGGPVFKLLDEITGQYLFVGINNGNEGGDSNIYSPMRQILQDMPSLCFAYGC